MANKKDVLKSKDKDKEKNKDKNINIESEKIQEVEVSIQDKQEEKIKKDHKILRSVNDFLMKYTLIPYIIIGIALFFLAMMLTAQMKTISNTEEILAGKREAQLSDDLVNLQRKYNDLKEKYEASEEVVEEYQTNSSTNSTLISSMKDQIEQLSMISGTTDLSGEGITITLTDGSKIKDADLRSDALVHDSDVLTVVNELKAAGAEAISVNGQRIIATSAIRCVGPVIQVNYQKVAAPFEIKAIGNAQYLESAMSIKNGVTDMLKEYGVGVAISRQQNVSIPKYEGTINFKSARVVK